MSASTCLAELRAVSRAFGPAGRETIAVRELSLRAHAGELVLLLGPSGSGKTTLLTLLAGLQRPTAGEVFLFGRPVPSYSPRELQRVRAARIGFVFQSFHLLDSLDVLENVLLVTRFAGVPRARARARASALLARMGVERLARARPAQLSQGEKQRVAVARALVNGAPLILADEPTGSLATDQGLEVVRMIRETVSGEDRGAVVVSHDERMAGLADRVLHLCDGRLSDATSDSESATALATAGSQLRR